jgi:hypothetical protein
MLLPPLLDSVLRLPILVRTRMVKDNLTQHSKFKDCEEQMRVMIHYHRSPACIKTTAQQLKLTVTIK